jgi:hypothetical protein
MGAPPKTARPTRTVKIGCIVPSPLRLSIHRAKVRLSRKKHLHERRTHLAWVPSAHQFSNFRIGNFADRKIGHQKIASARKIKFFWKH